MNNLKLIDRAKITASIMVAYKQILNYEIKEGKILLYKEKEPNKILEWTSFLMAYESDMNKLYNKSFLP